MKRILLAAALLAGASIPAWAFDTGRYGLEWVQIPETMCLLDEAKADAMWRSFRHQMGHENPDPIATCKVAPSRIPTAMDFLVGTYTGYGNAPTWVENNCHAEPAIPRNKWVCWEARGEDDQEGITREWR